ncbi:MAG: hypothetical protein V4508_00605 [Pseudomonadota bacterium]
MSLWRTTPALLLAACAATAPPELPLVSAARIMQLAQDGADSRAVQAALGPARRVRFDSGYQVWAYQTAPGAAGAIEFVILIGPDGRVRKLRQRPIGASPNNL